MFNRIIVPFDISDYSRAAADEAIEFARSVGGSTTFIHIVEPEPYHDELYDYPSADKVVENEIADAARKWFSQVEKVCVEKNVPTSMQILFHKDSVARTIARYAEDVDADLIVIGHHHTHGFGKWLEENVAKGIIDHAPCSVWVTIKKQV